MSDLRSFLARVRAERPADLFEIDREVDGRFETAAILTKLEAQQRSPILFFKRVTGTALPVVTNVCGSMGRIAFAGRMALASRMWRARSCWPTLPTI